ncbi:MAG: NAD(P)/FAD-dependent oxidoreductase, partial [Nitrospinota bacterium]
MPSGGSGEFTREGALIIVGASAAGVSALKAILRVDGRARVTMITEETSPPYCPTALHHLLSGKMPPESIKLLEERELKDSGIELLTGVRVTSVDPSRHKILTERGDALAYTKLLIATGAEPTLPAVPGLDSESVFTFRTMADSERLLPLARPGERVASLGGGLIGLQVALALMERGVSVTVVEREGQLLPLHFDEEAASIVEDAFRERGLTVFKNSTLSSARRDRRGLTLSLSSGEELQGFSALVVAVGLRPRVGLLSGSGVDIDQGVL